MKYLLSFFTIVTVVSCQNRQAEIDAQKNIIPFDTALYKSNYSTDHAQDNLLPGTAAYNTNTGVRAPYHSAAVRRTTANRTRYAVAPSKPRGWSSAAKGATIGGVGGAILGGVITHKVGGAVIGGIIGAGGGYAIGRARDRKTGRVAQGKAYRRYYATR
ncbi:MAG: glycine zipper domain-containing protein [Ginsengibacter sp.]